MSEYLSEKDLLAFGNETALVGGSIQQEERTYRNSRSGVRYQAIKRCATLVDRMRVFELAKTMDSKEISQALDLTAQQVRDLLRS